MNLGYFRTSQYFFSFTFQAVKEDVRFIIKSYFAGSSFPMKQISNRQYYSNRQVILNKYEMSLYCHTSVILGQLSGNGGLKIQMRQI